MSIKWFNLAAAGFLALNLACADGTVPAEAPVPADSGSDAQPVELGVPGRANANVSVASDGDFLIAAWSAAEPEGAADIFTAVSRDGGRTFSDPVRVNSEPGTARVSGEQPPRLVLAKQANADPVVSLIWTASGEDGTRLLTSQSVDGARTFEPSELVPGTDAPGNRGWESLTAFGNGIVAAAWLDHRQHAQNSDVASTHHHHDAAADPNEEGVAMAARSQLYFAAFDGESEPKPLTGGVCYCCKTALATGMFGSSDTVAVAWRHVYPGNMRDIAFTVSRDQGRTFSAPVRASEDQWSITGCPDDGPSMAVDGEGRVHLVWPTAVTENGQPVKALFHTMTADGVTFTPRVKLPTQGQANHPQIAAASDGSLVAIWDESGSGSRSIARARGVLDASGQIAFSRSAASGVETGVYPIVLAGDSEVVSIWTAGPPTESTLRVARSSISSF
ncbi:MAG: sialidase family protein [Vicinamibacterales bacterium]